MNNTYGDKFIKRHLEVGGNITPAASGSSDIGSVSLAFDDAHIDQIYLKANPTDPLQAATKQYVDTAVLGENLWDRSGTTLIPHTSGDIVSINANSSGALLVEQDGVNDNVLIVDTTNARVGVNCVPTVPFEVQSVAATPSYFGNAMGIGCVNTNGALDVFKDTDAVVALGKAKVGYNGTDAGYATFSHYDNMTNLKYALSQGAAGDTYLNSAGTTYTRIYANGATLCAEFKTTLDTMFLPTLINTNSTTALLVEQTGVVPNVLRVNTTGGWVGIYGDPTGAYSRFVVNSDANTITMLGATSVRLLMGTALGTVNEYRGMIDYNFGSALMDFWTGGASRMQLNNTGLGIGCTPTSSLEVNGTVLASGVIDHALTSGRIVLAGAAGLLEDSASLTFNGTTLTTPDIHTTNGQIVTAPASNLDIANKEYVDLVSQGLSWQEPVESFWDASAGLPVGPALDVRYICLASGTGWTINRIYQYNGATWDEQIPEEAWALWVNLEDTDYVYNGAAWVKFAATLTHNNLSGLQGLSPYNHLSDAEYAGSWGARFLTAASGIFGGVSANSITASGKIDMTGNNIVSVADPLNDQDAATKKYVDDAVLVENLWDRTGTTLIPHTAGDIVLVNANSTTALKVEQTGVKNNTLVVDTTNGGVAIATAAGASSRLIISEGITTGEKATGLLYLDNTWPAYPRTISRLEASITTNDNTASTGPVVGLNLYNTSQTDLTYSPLITFSRKSVSGDYNSPFAWIGAQRTANGSDTDWQAGDLVFGTSSTTSVGPREKMRLTKDGYLGIGCTPTTTLQIAGDTTPSASGTYDLGTVAIAWDDAHIDKLHSKTSIDTLGTLTVSGNAAIRGDLLLDASGIFQNISTLSITASGNITANSVTCPTYKHNGTISLAPDGADLIASPFMFGSTGGITTLTFGPYNEARIDGGTDPGGSGSQKITIQGGSGFGEDGADLDLQGGDALFFGDVGGDINIRAGDSSWGTTGGNVTIRAGTGSSTNGTISIGSNMIPTASGVSSIGTTALAFASGVFDNLHVNTTPTEAQDAVNKAYVDSQIAGENYWDRSGTVLTPATLMDSLSYLGDVTASGTVTASGGFTDGLASLRSGSLTGARLGALTTDGFVKTTGGQGILNVDTSTYFINPMSALGDIIYGGALGAGVRLPVGGAHTVLHADGATPSWESIDEEDISLSNNTTNNTSVAQHGFAPKLSNLSSQFLDGQGNWSIPVGGSSNDYQLTTFSGQTSVTVTHGFGSYPIVQVMNDVGAVIVPQSIVNNSINDFTVTFTVPTSGSIMSTIGGPQSFSVKIVTGDYTVLRTDKNVQSSASGVNITLPWASGVTGYEYRIDNSSPGDITLLSGSGYIQHELYQTIPTDSCLMCYSDGLNWRVT